MRREEILNQIWDFQDNTYDVMTGYESSPHCYGGEVLYQAEAYIINRIGLNPDITTTELAVVLDKSASACSQTVKKLVEKGLVVQTRNQNNRRQYNLRLTSDGEIVYQSYLAFNKHFQAVMFRALEEFSDEELEAYFKVQKRINEAYLDI